MRKYRSIRIEEKTYQRIKKLAKLEGRMLIAQLNFAVEGYLNHAKSKQKRR